MRLMSSSVGDSSPDCLDPEYIAALAAGSDDVAGTPVVTGHLFHCDRCRSELASVARLLDAPEVRTELDRLERPHQHRGRRTLIVGAWVAAAAAALVIVVGRPSSSRLSRPVFREESVTASAAPRLVAPLGAAANIDAFEWTSVPRADRYRIIVYARDGSVIWEALTRDTVITSPDVVRQRRDTVLWGVASHVGWEDRWTASDLSMLTLARAR